MYQKLIHERVAKCIGLSRLISSLVCKL